MRPSAELWFDRVRAGDVAAVQELLARGAHLTGEGASSSGGKAAEVRCERGATALHHAVHAGLVDVTRLLLRAGLDVNARCTIAGGTPLMWAASRNQVASVRLLLEEGGADPGRPAAPPGSVVSWDTQTAGTPLGETALHVASQYGFADVCRVLVRFGQLQTPNEYGQTALHVAAAFGRQEAADTLISAGAQLEQPDAMGSTPLMAAAERGHCDAAFTLLWRGADPAPVLADPSLAASPQSASAAALCRRWAAGELRAWSPDAHRLFPHPFRRDAAAALLATLGSGAAAGRAKRGGAPNVLRELRAIGLFDLILHQLLLLYMARTAACRRAPPRRAESESDVRRRGGGGAQGCAPAAPAAVAAGGASPVSSTGGPRGEDEASEGSAVSAV